MCCRSCGAFFYALRRRQTRVSERELRFVQFNTRAGAHCKAGLCRRLTQPPKRQVHGSAKTMIRGRLCHSLRRWRRVMGACGGGQSRGIHELDELDEQPRQATGRDKSTRDIIDRSERFQDGCASAMHRLPSLPKVGVAWSLSHGRKVSPSTMLGRSRKTLQLGLWDERRRLRVISSHLAGGRCTQQEMQGPQVLQSRVFVMTGTQKYDSKIGELWRRYFEQHSVVFLDFRLATIGT